MGRRCTPKMVYLKAYEKVYLSGQLGNGLFVNVDHSDCEDVAQFRWYYGNGYAARTIRIFSGDAPGSRRRLPMANHILGVPPGVVVDHINGDPWDNRRENLRVATPAQNRANNTKPVLSRSGYRGVYERPERNVWVSVVNSKPPKVLGHFDTKEEAAFAYNLAVFERWGEFARLNDIPFSEFSRFQRCEFFRREREEKHVRRSNTSGYLGVLWEEDRGRWRASIRLNCAHVRLGSFATALDAAKAYNAGVRRYFGSDAITNPVDGDIKEWENILTNSEIEITPQHNTSGYLGVSFAKANQKWMAYLDRVVGRVYLGF